MKLDHTNLLQSFRMSSTLGFLPENELHPSQNNRDWREVEKSLPKLLNATALQASIDELDAFSLEGFKDKSIEEKELDMRCLSYIAHAWLWNTKEKVVEILPKKIAQPWVAIAQELGRPPVLSYASYCLYNWKRFDRDQPPYLGNIAIESNFLGGRDEDWFILIHVDIEAHAGTLFPHMCTIMECLQHEDSIALESSLAAIVHAWENINASMKRMTEHCDPYIYYTRVRPYIFGSKNNPALPNGLIYEGCFDHKAKFFRGETGAQSSIVPSMDALLGISHQNDPLKEYLMEMREYMVPAHRKFIEYVEKNSSLREFLEKKKTSSLIELYNRCIEELHQFRETHLEFAASYIHRQAPQNNNDTVMGTGGTPFMKYLAKHRDETLIRL
ncbi:MAG: hypothetical protein R3A11_02850 [Bdellovibrionota bacterium]